MSLLPSNALFVAGTDTDVGKTYLCARLLEYLKLQGVRSGYQKWVATGTETEIPEDLAQCLAAAGIEPTPDLVSQQVPYSFRFPASPHLAAELEDKSIDPEVISERFKTLGGTVEWLIVEGVGGLMVPLRRDLLLVDLVARLKPRVLLVARSGLGTLNHTLLSLEALRSRKVPVMGVVFSDSEGEQNESLVEDNMRTVEEIGLVRVFGRLERYYNDDEAQKAFMPVGQAILEQLRHGGP